MGKRSLSWVTVFMSIAPLAPGLVVQIQHGMLSLPREDNAVPVAAPEDPLLGGQHTAAGGGERRRVPGEPTVEQDGMNAELEREIKRLKMQRSVLEEYYVDQLLHSDVLGDRAPPAPGVPRDSTDSSGDPMDLPRLSCHYSTCPAGHSCRVDVVNGFTVLETCRPDNALPEGGSTLQEEPGPRPFTSPYTIAALNDARLLETGGENWPYVSQDWASLFTEQLQAFNEEMAQVVDTLRPAEKRQSLFLQQELMDQQQRQFLEFQAMHEALELQRIAADQQLLRNRQQRRNQAARAVFEEGSGGE